MTDERTIRARRARTWGARACLALLLVAAGCLYDGQDRCGPHQRVDEKGYCVCVEGARLDPKTASCAAPAAVPDGGVASVPGVACSASSPCADATYPVCHTSKAGDAYCTKACTADADCPVDFACDTSTPSPLCRRAAKGQGKTCESPSDCQGGDATFCPAPDLKSCVVEDCSLTASGSCDKGWTCCDVGTARVGFLKTLCLPVPACP